MTKVLGTIIAVVLLGLGLLFLMAAAKANPGPRALVGLISIGMGAGVAWITLAKKPEVVKKVELTQKIDLSGDVNLDTMKCKHCGAELDRKSVEVRAGAVFIKCPYCGNDYQVTEDPKW